jgi:hypothetical protein
MEAKQTRVSAKISRRDSLRVTIKDSAGDELVSLVNCSYENLEALQNDARRKLPMGYDKKMFEVSIVCEQKNLDRTCRIPVARPIKRKR